MESIVDIFFACVKEGNREAVQDLLAEHPNLVQIRDTDGLSAVLTAVYHGQPAIAELLVDRGAPLDLFEAAAVGRAERVQAILNRDPAQINDFSADGYQALGLAAFFGHLEVVEMLLEREAEVNTPSRNSMRVRPLNSAAAGGHLKIVRALLDHGADPNARPAGDFTPLHSAAQNGHVEMVRLLLERGADPNALANTKTAADLAREAGHAELAELLSQKA